MPDLRLPDSQRDPRLLPRRVPAGDVPAIELSRQICPWPQLKRRWERTLRNILYGDLHHLKANNTTIRLATEALSLRIDTLSSVSIRLTDGLSKADFMDFVAAVEHSRLNAIRIVWESDAQMDFEDSSTELFSPSDDEAEEPTSEWPLRLINAVARNARIQVVALELEGRQPHPDVLECLQTLEGREIHLSLGSHRGPWSADQLQTSLCALNTKGPALHCLSLAVEGADEAPTPTDCFDELQRLPSTRLAELNLAFSSIPSRALARQLLVHFIRNHQLHTLTLRSACWEEPPIHASGAELFAGDMQAILEAVGCNTTLTTLEIDVACSEGGVCKPTDGQKRALSKLMGRNLAAWHHRNLNTPAGSSASASRRLRQVARHHQLPIWSQDEIIVMLYTPRLHELWNAVGQSLTAGEALRLEGKENARTRQQYISDALGWKATRVQQEMKSKLGYISPAQVDDRLAELRAAAGVEPGYHVIGKPTHEFDSDDEND